MAAYEDLYFFLLVLQFLGDRFILHGLLEVTVRVLFLLVYFFLALGRFFIVLFLAFLPRLPRRACKVPAMREFAP